MRSKRRILPWVDEVSHDLAKAFASFYRRVKEKKAGRNVKVGFPRFKSKKHGLGGFRLTGAIRVFEKAVQLPRLGVLRLKECGCLPTSGMHILSATVSERGACWFVSLQVEMEVPGPVMEEKPVAGVDLGINRMAQVSDGTCFENPRALKRSLTRLKRLQRVVSRRQKGSANRQKAFRQLARAHFRVANIRKDALHQATTFLTTMAPPARAGGTMSAGSWPARARGTAVKCCWQAAFSRPPNAVGSLGTRKRSAWPGGCLPVSTAAR
jgi:putative transposase